MPNSNPMATSDIAAVAIGRNEGTRLHACLKSLQEHVPVLVYVDSGSTDGSVDFARSLGAHVVELDLSVPFTAARARNEGLAAAQSLCPSLRFVQFVDGDCEIFPNWIPAALKVLEEQPQVAVVCGRRRERHPDQTPYNLLCDIEWNTPVGVVLACGGDALMRVAALNEVEGYNEALIAGEEPEMCFRLRHKGWQVLRIDQDMTWHDADMHRFSQWWKRTQRAGHAFAEHALLHGRDPERMGVKETRSNVLWATAAGVSVVAPLLAPVGMAAFGASTYRIFKRQKAQGLTTKPALLYAASCMAGKIPQTLGAAQLAWRRLRGRRSTLIEYK